MISAVPLPILGAMRKVYRILYWQKSGALYSGLWKAGRMKPTVFVILDSETRDKCSFTKVVMVINTCTFKLFENHT